MINWEADLFSLPVFFNILFMNSNSFQYNLKKLQIASLLSICLLLTSACHAQSKIGIQVGKSYSKFDVINGNGYKFYDFSNSLDHEGYLFDFFYSYSLNKFFSLKPNIGYVKRGAIIKRDYGWVGFDKFSLKYFDISAALRFSPVKYVTLNCGINYNFLIRAIAYYGKDGVGFTTDHYNRFDFGFEGGVTITVKDIFLNANYFRSINPIRTIDFSSVNPNITNTVYRNKSLEFSIGYQFVISKNKKKQEAKNGDK